MGQLVRSESTDGGRKSRGGAVPEGVEGWKVKARAITIKEI